MLAEPAAQANLLRLADLDSELARVTHAAKTLPQHESITLLMAQRRAAADGVTAASTSADDLAVAARRAEQDLVPVRARLERDEQRVSDGSVNDSRALQAILDEIDHLKGRISDLEELQLDAMARAEDAVAAREAVAARKLQIEVQLREAVTLRDERVAELKREAQALQADRASVAALIPAALLQIYERLRASTGMGAAPLAGGRCGGCRLQLNVSEMDRIRKAAPNAVCRCPECDRILVRTEGR